MRTFRRLLVASDFEASSRHALDLAIGLASEQGAALTLLHVFEIPAWSYGAIDTAADLLTPLEDAAAQMLATELARVRQVLPQAESLLRRGVAPLETLKVASSLDADLIVTGTHGRGILGRAALGSVAATIVNRSRIPVLTVRMPG